MDDPLADLVVAEAEYLVAYAEYLDAIGEAMLALLALDALLSKGTCDGGKLVLSPSR